MLLCDCNRYNVQEHYYIVILAIPNKFYISRFQLGPFLHISKKSESHDHCHVVEMIIAQEGDSLLYEWLYIYEKGAAVVKK